MLLPIYLSEVLSIPYLLAIASIFQGYQLPLAIILIGFNHREALGKGKILNL